MTRFLSKNNVRNDICDIHKKNLCGFDTEVASKQIYDYALNCCNGIAKFNEKVVAKMLRSFTPDVETQSFRQMFAVIAMYSFENLVNDFVNHMVSEDMREEAKNVGMGCIYAAALKYDFHNEFRYLFELEDEPLTVDLYPKAAKFITYATTAVINALKKFNRDMFWIKTPDHEAVTMAIIDSYFRSLDTMSKRCYAIELEELFKIMDEKKINSSRKTINALVWAWRAEKSLHMDCGDLSNIEDTSHSWDNLEMFGCINDDLNDCIAEVYGEEIAYISYLKHDKGMSTYTMVDSYERFALVNKCIEIVAATNEKSIPFVEQMKRGLRLGGEKRARAEMSRTNGSIYLEAAIKIADDYHEKINCGETTVEKIIGKKVNAANLNYQYRKAWPVKMPTGKDLPKHMEFRKVLARRGLDSILKGIKKRCI